MQEAPPSRSSRRTDGLGDSGGEAASLREAPLPQTPSPEEQLGIDWSALWEVRAHESWARVPAVWLWSRRLTEPPRPASARNERYVLLLLYPPAARMRKQPMASRHGLFSIRRPPRRMSAAALSAAVDSHTVPARRRTQPTGGTNSAEASPSKRQPLFGREGSGGRGASLREAASPQNPPVSSSVIALVHACACGGGHFFPDGRLGPG